MECGDKKIITSRRQRRLLICHRACSKMSRRRFLSLSASIHSDTRLVPTLARHRRMSPSSSLYLLTFSIVIIG